MTGPTDNGASPSRPIEIADGVFRFDTPLGERFCSLFLFVDGDPSSGPEERGAVLFDAGVDGAVSTHVVPGLAGLGIRASNVRHVVLSHCDVDHFGGLADARASLPGAVTVAHELDAPAMSSYAVYESDRARSFRQAYGIDEDPEVLAWARSVTREGPIDLTLQGDSTLDLGDRTLDVLHVPGHSRGHLAILDNTRGVLAVSDAVLGSAVPLADGSPAFPPTYRYVDEYLATIARFAGLLDGGVRRLVTAHYGTYDGDAAREFLVESKEFADSLDFALHTALGETPVTAGELLERLNGQVGAWPVEGTAGALLFPVAGHLERGIAAGSIVRSENADGTGRFAARGGA